jgi:hypothetical protein
MKQASLAAADWGYDKFPRTADSIRRSNRGLIGGRDYRGTPLTKLEFWSQTTSTQAQSNGKIDLDLLDSLALASTG